LLQGIQSRREIVLPAGKATFNWIDICNIGEAGAVVLNQFDDFKNQEIEITGKENEDFHKVTCLINQILHKPVTYKSVSPCKFYRLKRLEEVPKGMIIVMILLHFLSRFQKEPKISDCYEQLTGKKPTELAGFIKRERQKFGL